MDTSDLETIILRELTGNVLVYSSPLPSALSNANGKNNAKIAPMDVASSTIAVLSTPKFEINRAIMTVSSTGKAKKKAVAGFFEATFRSFKT